MKVYRIKIDGADNGYVKGVLFSIEEGFQVIATNNQEEAGWYEEDKAKVYCKELNKQAIEVEFKLEEVENNEKK